MKMIDRNGIMKRIFDVDGIDNEDLELDDFNDEH